MGKGMTGGVLAAPIFTEFMKVALKDAPPKEFQVPPGIELIPIDRRTGLRAQAGGDGVILEASSRAPRRRRPTRSSATRIRWASPKASRPTQTGLSRVEPAGFTKSLRVRTAALHAIDQARKRSPRLSLDWRKRCEPKYWRWSTTSERRGADPEASLTGMSPSAACRS